jgi:hypothetical protein
MKKALVIGCLFIWLGSSAQQFEAGFVYSPLQMSSMSFDKPFLIFSDYTSLTINTCKLRPDFTLLSTGVFFRYRTRTLYYQAEIDFFENKFRKSIADWKTNGDRYFTYSAIEVPLLIGYTLNPGSMRKIKVFGGINNKIGKFRTVFFSTLRFSTTENKDYEYYSELPKKLELIDKFSFYYADVTGGIGFSYYGLQVDVRAETNITELNKTIYEYNANYKRVVVIRLTLNMVIPKREGNTKK